MVRGSTGLRCLRLRLVALAITCVVAGGVVACARTVGFDEWVVKADALCRKAQEDFDANPPPQSQLPGERLRAAATRTRPELEGLRKLPEPDSRASAVADYLRVVERRIEVLELYAADLDKTASNAAAPPVATLTEVTTDALTRSAALGLTRCGAGVDVSLTSATTTTSGLSASAPVPTAIGGQPEDQENTVDEAG